MKYCMIETAFNNKEKGKNNKIITRKKISCELPNG